jgi:hypothetical protein
LPFGIRHKRRSPDCEDVIVAPASLPLFARNEFQIGGADIF